ncbi:MAG: NfeD family protein [Planctomycetota bacterium]
MRKWPPVFLSVVLLALLSAGIPGQRPAAADEDVRVLVVPVHGQIGVRTVYMVQSALRTAQDQAVSWVILDIDTHGGEVPSSKEIDALIADLAGSEVRTVAWVRHYAQSAGAYIALSCSELFMAPGSSIGAIVPVIMGGPTGIQQIPEPDIRNKLFAALRADVRAMIERRGNARPGLAKLAEAMVDPSLEVFEVTYEDESGVQMTGVLEREELRGLEERGLKILDRRSFPTRPLALSAEEATRIGFATGVSPSIEALVREELNEPVETIRYRDETWSEEAVAWLDGMKPVLFVLGFLLLLIEFKTPGVALPGILGLGMLGLAMFGSYLVGLAEWTEILLFFLGLGLVAVEILVFPVMVFGIAGVLCVGTGLVLSQQSFLLPENAAQEGILLGNVTQMFVLTIIVLVGSLTFWLVLPRVPGLRRILLPAPALSSTGAATSLGRREGADELRARILGREGVALTDLRPVGTMEIDSERYDAMTLGAYAVAGQRVLVIDAQLNQIIVEPVEDPAGGEQGDTGQVHLSVLILMWLVGLGFVLAEIFFPSAGVLSILAGLSLVSAIFLGYLQHGPITGHALLVTALVAIPATMIYGFRWLPHTAVGRWMMLAGPSPEDVHGAATAQGLEQYLHARGVALCDLRPTGIARIHGKRVDVVTRGELLEKDTSIVVLEIVGNRIVVTQDDAVAAESMEERRS